MRRSFSHTLLITWIFLQLACTSQYFHTSTQGQNHFVTDSLMPVDSQLVALYSPYKQKLEKNISQIIAVSGEEMIKSRPESKLTNFLGDLLLEEGTRYLNQQGNNLHPDISFFNYGGIRTFFPKGEITVGKIFELMPFENEMVFLLISGQQVQEFLNRLASNGGESVGGIRFAISGNKAIDISIGGIPLNQERYYWLVTNDYVASGGDGMEVLTYPKEKINSGLKIRDAIISYLEREYGPNKEIHVELDGRISHK